MGNLFEIKSQVNTQVKVLFILLQAKSYTKVFKIASTISSQKIIF
jgi:hypothetical protein